MTLAELLAERTHVLLDFDGPVCAVFSGTSARAVTQRLAEIVRSHGIDLPDDVSETADPFDVLRATAEAGSDAAALAESALRALEVEAVATARITPGIEDALDALRVGGHTVTIVSNNSSEAVYAFLITHGVAGLVRGVVARIDPDPSLLKPDPHLVHTAVQQLAADPGECVLIGDSTSDIIAAHAVGTAAIAYANKPGKRELLVGTRPEVIIESIDEITRAASAPPAH